MIALFKEGGKSSLCMPEREIILASPPKKGGKGGKLFARCCLKKIRDQPELPYPVIPPTNSKTVSHRKNFKNYISLSSSRSFSILIVSTLLEVR